MQALKSEIHLEFSAICCTQRTHRNNKDCVKQFVWNLNFVWFPRRSLSVSPSRFSSSFDFFCTRKQPFQFPLLFPSSTFPKEEWKVKKANTKTMKNNNMACDFVCYIYVNTCFNILELICWTFFAWNALFLPFDHCYHLIWSGPV